MGNRKYSYSSRMKRALIVDDEAPARKELRQLLAVHPEIKIVGEAAGVKEARALFRDLRPDLVFLDVQMPKKDGFSLLPELQPVPDIIFITAYDCFAVKAFEVNAVDFLVKPIRADRLALALSRLVHPVERKPKPILKNDPVFLYSDLELRVVPATEITHIEAEENYSRVHTTTRPSILVRRKMSEWTKLLPPDVFLRPYRSLIVNRQAVKSIVPHPCDHAIVTFSSGNSWVELGRGASRRLRRALREMA